MKHTQKLQCLDGPPLDYSFKNIRSLNELLQQNGQKQTLKSLIQQQQSKDQTKKSSNQQHNTNQQQQNNNQQNKQSVNNPYQTKLQIIRTIQISEAKILDLNKNASKKKQKNQKKQIKVVQSKSSSIFLRYNKIISIQGLFPIVQKIFPNINNLIWIDLSFNRLVELCDDFKMFPNLKNVYLHSNYIFEFKQLEKLASVKQLRSITIYANPLEKYQEFRVLISNIIPQLQKIDSTLLTKRQKERGQIIGKQMKKYPLIKNPQSRPEQSDNQEEN